MAVISSSNGNALRVDRDPASSLNHRADYSQVSSAVVAVAGEGKWKRARKDQRRMNFRVEASWTAPLRRPCQN